MKTGLVTALSAVILFTGTVVWSAFKLVPQSAFKVSELKPDRFSADTYFFNSEVPGYINVDAPAFVEIDNSFTGIELQGDTSLFSYLQVTVSTASEYSQNNISIVFKSLVATGSAPDLTKEQQVTQDFLHLEALRKAHVVVRIGIGEKKIDPFGSLNFTFQHCKKVTTQQPLAAANLWLSIFQTDSVQMNLHAGDLTINFPSFSVRNPPQWIKLEGKSDRVAANNFSAGVFDATGLKVRDFYMQNLKNADVRISASHLARIRQVEDCKIQVEGNPEYKWIE